MLSYQTFNLYDKLFTQVPLDIAEAKEKYDLVIVSFHWGAEKDYAPKANQQKMGKLAIDAGADLVIMHHPHVVQGMDIYKNRSICYSLGNFAFGGNASVKAIETVVVDAALTFDDDGTYLGQQLTLYPANISGSYPQNNFQPILVSGDAAQAVMKLIQLDTPYELAPYTDEAGCAQQPYLPAKDGDMEPVSIEEFSVEDD